jgi:hypothetical protein
LWFQEKDLFRKFGAGTNKADSADYADAARETVDMIMRGDLLSGFDESNYENDQDDTDATEGQYSPSRVADDAQQRGASPAGLPPQFGQARSKSVKVRGVHYSGQERQSLNTAYYGTGLKGEERDRLNDPRNADIKPRAFFYVDEGQGIFPENGVGEQAHDVDLNNLYDVKADPIGYRKLAAGDASKMERLILKGGFDGYYAPGIFGRQGVAVLVGQHNPKVRALGTGYRGGDAVQPKAEPKPTNAAADRVESARNLPSGKMSGSDWKRMVPEATMLEDGKDYYKSDVVAAMRAGEAKYSPVAQFSPGRFYSQLERAVEQTPDRIFNTAPQFKMWLNANAAKLGIKRDEIEWTGIGEYLDTLGKGKVTKADVLSYLEQNGVKVEEVEKGRAGFDEDNPQLPPGSKWEVNDEGRERYPYQVITEDGDVMGYGATESEAIEDAYAGHPEYWDKKDSTTYSQYVLPGGENYRELLLTLPEKHVYPKTPVLTQEEQKDFQYLTLAMRRNGSLLPPEMAEWKRLKQQRDAYDNELEDISRAGGNKQPFRSSHWSEDNILAHVRFNDRTDADGAKVLFIEELQSDWGQQGKKEGFDNAKVSEREEAAFRALKERIAKATEDDSILRSGNIENSQKLAEKAGLLQEFNAAMVAMWNAQANNKKQIPAAPFVTKTEAWLGLGIKRMIAYAVENGYDKVAFVNGEQSADRYNLAKVIDYVEYEKTGDNSYYLRVTDQRGGHPLTEYQQTADDLESKIGKDLAMQIVRGDGQLDRESGNKMIRAKDFVLGGEGMKTFYDVIVPQVTSDVLKKLGGGKVESVSLETSGAAGSVDPTSGAVLGPNAKAKRTNQTGFTITPSMKEKVEQGMPLFSPPRNLAGHQIAQTWQSTDVTGFDNVVRKLQDKLVDTKRVVAAIKEAGNTFDERFDPYDQELLFHGRAAKKTHDFADLELKPFLNDMRLRGIEMEELQNYLWAKHAHERNLQIGSTNPNMPDGGSGLTDQEATAILAGNPVTKNGTVIKIDPAKMRGYDALGAKIKQINEGTMQLLVDYGLESQDTINAWKATYKNYVPLMRDMESDDNFAGAMNLGLGTGQGFSVKGSSSRRAMGSERDVKDIIANIAMQRERAIVRGEKNRVAVAVYALSLKASNPEFWIPINPDANKVGMQKTAQELVAMGLNPIDAQALAMEPKQQYIDPRTGFVAERINPQLRNRNDVLAVRVNGKDRYVAFSSDERARAMITGLKNLDAEQLGYMMQNVAGVTRWFASVNTQYNPVFGLVNGVRDFQSAMLNLSSTAIAGKQKEVAKYGISALAGIYSDLRAHRDGKVPTSRWAQEFEEFAKEGGQTGYRDMFQNSKARTDGLEAVFKELATGKFRRWAKISEVNPIFAWLSDYNTSIENAFRLAAYKVAKEQGLSKQQAALLAKNLTVNFNKKGTAATQAGALYAFFNAAVQGTARIGTTMLENKGNPSDYKSIRLSKAGKQILLGGMVLGVMQAVMGALAGWDDDEPPQFQREKNFIIPVPGTDKYVSIPMPLGFHVIPNMTRIATEFALSGFKNPGKRGLQVVSVFADAFNPIGSSGNPVQMLSPTVTDPLVALNSNQDWNGRSIYKEDFNKRNPTPGWTRAKETATPWAKALSYGTNWISGGFGPYEKGLASPTPDQIDYLIGQITGGVGREAGKVAQTIESGFSGESLPMHKIPVAGRFVGETKGVSSEVGRFYRNLEIIGEHKDPIKRMQEDGQHELVKAYLDENPIAGLEDEAGRVSRLVSDVDKLRRKAIERGDKAEVKRLEDRKKTLMNFFNAKASARLQPGSR